jgi:amino acid transporter
MDIEKDTASGGRRESTFAEHRRGSQFDPVNEGIVTEDVNKLKRGLHGRHMQMIAIGMLSID